MTRCVVVLQFIMLKYVSQDSNLLTDKDTTTGKLPLIKEEAESDYSSETELFVDEEGTSVVVSEVSIQIQ